jgi:hypothetical protein
MSVGAAPLQLIEFLDTFLATFSRHQLFAVILTLSAAKGKDPRIGFCFCFGAVLDNYS